ncbi:hypothetical protein KKH35_02430, partial [Patescibacteria group bacterium]|nr:hypothetical protein [Patescibacteria group bacterium]
GININSSFFNTIFKKEEKMPKVKMPKRCVVCDSELNGLVTLAGNLKIYYGNEGSSKRKALIVDFSDMTCSVECILKRVKEALSNTDLPKKPAV